MSPGDGGAVMVAEAAAATFIAGENESGKAGSTFLRGNLRLLATHGDFHPTGMEGQNRQTAATEIPPQLGRGHRTDGHASVTGFT